jgi:hypothetical protein
MSGRLRARLAEMRMGLRAVRFSAVKCRDVGCIFVTPQIAPQIVKQINDGPYPLWPCYVAVCVGAGVGLIINGVFG